MRWIFCAALFVAPALAGVDDVRPTLLPLDNAAPFDAPAPRALSAPVRQEFVAPLREGRIALDKQEFVAQSGGGSLDQGRVALQAALVAPYVGTALASEKPASFEAKAFDTRLPEEKSAGYKAEALGARLPEEKSAWYKAEALGARLPEVVQASYAPPEYCRRDGSTSSSELFVQVRKLGGGDYTVQLSPFMTMTDLPDMDSPLMRIRSDGEAALQTGNTAVATSQTASFVEQLKIAERRRAIAAERKAKLSSGQ
ncbi:MAG: hypothetical protein NTV49_10815 [Kiritimatiellaeota bacterium]|nr:hypothetical protein [Kiritimatiellota bacterium]